MAVFSLFLSHKKDLAFCIVLHIREMQNGVDNLSYCLTCNPANISRILAKYIG